MRRVPFCRDSPPQGAKGMESSTFFGMEYMRAALSVRPFGELIKLKVIIHKAGEGGYWTEVRSIPGCAAQGETFEELLQSLYGAVEGCLAKGNEAYLRFVPS
jgi:predicted RNase H-like HicB family nuclease